jgi:hypothetical protein
MKIITSTLAFISAFAIFAFSALLGWPFQFGVGVASYFIGFGIKELFKVKLNIHYLVLPFFILYFSLGIYDLLLQPEIFNIVSFPIGLTPILSVLLFRLNTNKFILCVLSLTMSYFIFYVCLLCLPVIVQKTDLSISNKIYFHNNKNTYWWSTSCGYCIEKFDDLRPLIRQNKIQLCCIAKTYKDGIRAAKIIAERNIKSDIKLDSIRLIPVRYFPTWAISNGDQEFVGDVSKIYPFTYNFSLNLVQLILYFKS